MTATREINRNFRVFTCTPKDFAGDETFFSRESGMFSRGLSLLGIESRAVMPGLPREGDDAALIRTRFENLQDPNWWKSHDLDGVILYSWAAPRYTPIAKAIRAAGIRLCVCMDTEGVVSPYANPKEWFTSTLYRLWFEGRGAGQKLRAFAKYAVESVAAPVARRRIRHYRAADVITVPTPDGLIWVKNEARRLGGEDLASKFHYLPHPQSHLFTYDETPKEKLVITVARWAPIDWWQKNPRVLLESYRRFLAMRPEWHGLIIGSEATRLLERLGLPPIKGLEFLDRMSSGELPAFYRKASIGFWSSRSEGQQGTAAQALCCGASVVSHGSANMSCFRHYVTRESGRLAARNTPCALTKALIEEADAWEAGVRDPVAISAAWTKEFHAKEVASRALGFLGLNPQ